MYGSRGIDPFHLQSVVRDLWAMRLEMLKDSIGNTDENLATQIFSTQSDVDDDDVDQTGRYAARATFHTKLPKLIETLGLCYLGFVLMRNPICFADVRKWVLAEDFVYLRVLHALPTDMKQRLPQNLRLGLEARVSLCTREENIEVTDAAARPVLETLRSSIQSYMISSASLTQSMAWISRPYRADCFSSDSSPSSLFLVSTVCLLHFDQR